MLKLETQFAAMAENRIRSFATHEWCQVSMQLSD